jgi:hypothetical protein
MSARSCSPSSAGALEYAVGYHIKAERTMNANALVLLGTIGGLLASAHGALAQRRNPRLDRSVQESSRRAPSAQIPLKAPNCDGTDPNCVAVRLDDLPTKEGVFFAAVPRVEPGEKVRGTLCTCDLQSCYDDEDARWKDVNPPPRGWSLVRLSESSLFKGWLRDSDPATWVIRWDGGALPSYSWNVYIGKSLRQGVNRVSCPAGGSRR